MRTLIDEYGDTGILQPPYEEHRRDSDGQQLGPKPKLRWARFYDLKQLLSPREPRVRDAVTDTQGHTIDGP